MLMTDIRTIKKGTTITISTGTYSSYGVRGVFLALKDIQPEDYEKFEVKAVTEDALEKSIARMVYLGYIKRLDTVEQHLGDYYDEYYPSIVEA